MASVEPSTPKPSAQRATRRLVPRSEREPQMLRVATRLFAEHGFAGVSMADIADAAGITKPMLYAYFDSKQGLYVACIERAADELLAALTASIDPRQPPEEQLWSGLNALFRFIEENRNAWRTFLVEAGAHGPDAAEGVRKLRADLGERLTGLLMRAAVDNGVSANIRTEVAIQARALIGSAEALADWWVEQGASGGPRELVALRLMNFAWMGLGDLLRGNLWLPVRPGQHVAIAPTDRRGGVLPIDPDSVVASLRQLRDDELTAGLRANRDVILTEVFARMADYVRLELLEHPTVIEWRITGSADGDVDRWQLIAEPSGATVERDGNARPAVTLELAPLELLRLVTGERQGPALYLSGKLRIEGDLIVAASLPELFRRPEPEDDR